MGVRILEDRESGEAVIYCSTTEWAFGPVFPSGGHAQAFLDWCPVDTRQFTSARLEEEYSTFRQERTCQWVSDLLAHPLNETNEEIEDAWQCPDPKCKGRKDPCPSPK